MSNLEHFCFFKLLCKTGQLSGFQVEPFKETKSQLAYTEPLKDH